MGHRAKSDAAGFTLIEVIIVMAIVVVLATLALPNALKSFKTQPLQEATQEVVELVEYARNRAVTSFNAHGIAIAVADGTTPGRLDLFEGNGPGCNSFNVAVDPIVRSIDLATFLQVEAGGESAQRVEIRLVNLAPPTLATLCFTPDGRVVDAATSQPVPSTLDVNYAAGDVVIALQRFTGNLADSLRHNVIIPYAGRPRTTFGDDIDSAAGEGGA